MIELIYVLIKIIMALFLGIPLAILIGVVDLINTKGQFNEILKDLKAFMNWMIPGF